MTKAPIVTTKATYRELSQAEVAKIFACTPAKINSWISNGCPFGYNGKNKVLDAKHVHDWLVEQALQKNSAKAKQSRASKSTPVDGDDLMNPDLGFDDNLDKYRYYKSEQAKLALEKEKGMLIEKESHDDFVRQAGDYVRNGFQSLPKKLSVKIAKLKDASQVEKLLESEIVAILSDLSKID